MPDAGPAPIAADFADVAAAGLVYVSDAEPGIRRKRERDGFAYVDADGRAVTEGRTLERIRKLAIPPAYDDVWICADPRGHLQATGRDARRRKQYRYHPRWRSVRDSGKFQRICEFGQRLPALRRRLKRDLAQPGLPRDKVLATVVSLLDRMLIRVGNVEYARHNKSYGLTTMQSRHVEFIPSGRARFRFRGKGGQWHELVLDDAHLVRIVRHCQRLPGQPLFQYLDDDGTRQTVDSGMVNDYLRQTMGDEFTAKDFRTWTATLRAIALLGATPLPDPPAERALAAVATDVVKQVAHELGNTPAVCRSSYIHPGVFAAWQQGLLADAGCGSEKFALALLRKLVFSEKTPTSNGPSKARSERKQS